MTDKYVLNAEGVPIPEPDIYAWGRWFESSSKERIVKQEHIGESRISTVFLGLNHRWTRGPPILWETMVFGGPLDQEQDRCSGNREQAQAMHDRMAHRLKEELEKRCEVPAQIRKGAQ